MEHWREILRGAAVHADADANSNSNSDTHTDAHIYAYADAMHGQMQPDAKAAPDCRASTMS